MPVAPYICAIYPPALPKPLSEIYTLPTFTIPTSLDDVRECFRILNDIEAHCLRNTNLLSSGDIHQCQTWAAVVARNIEIPQFAVAVDEPVAATATPRHEHRERHKKTPSKSSAFTALSAPVPSSKRPSRYSSDPVTPSTVPIFPASLPLVSPTKPGPSHERHRHRDRDTEREARRERESERARERERTSDRNELGIETAEVEREQEHVREAHMRSLRVHAVVQEEVKPLREKLELLQAHVQTLKHKRSARSSRHSKHAWTSQDEQDFHKARGKSRAP